MQIFFHRLFNFLGQYHLSGMMRGAEIPAQLYLLGMHGLMTERDGKLQKLDSPDALIHELGPYAVDETSESDLKSRYFQSREEAIAYLTAAGDGASLRATTLEDVFVVCAGRKL